MWISIIFSVLNFVVTESSLTVNFIRTTSEDQRIGLYSYDISSNEVKVIGADQFVPKGAKSITFKIQLLKPKHVIVLNSKKIAFGPKIYISPGEKVNIKYEMDSVSGIVGIKLLSKDGMINLIRDKVFEKMNPFLNTFSQKSLRKADYETQLSWFTKEYDELVMKYLDPLVIDKKTREYVNNYFLWELESLKENIIIRKMEKANIFISEMIINEEYFQKLDFENFDYSDNTTYLWGKFLKYGLKLDFKSPLQEYFKKVNDLDLKQGNRKPSFGMTFYNFKINNPRPLSEEEIKMAQLFLEIKSEEFENIFKGAIKEEFERVKLLDTNKNEVNLLQILKDSTINYFMDIWASWCVPCIRELPNSLSLENRIKKNLQTVFISVEKDYNKWRKASLKSEIPGVKSFFLKNDTVSKNIFKKYFNTERLPSYQLVFFKTGINILATSSARNIELIKNQIYYINEIFHGKK